MKKLVMIISLILIITAFSPSPQVPKSITRIKKQKTIALIHHKYLYFIQVQLNNKTANLLVDTGASASLLDINQAENYRFNYIQTSHTFSGVGGGLSDGYKITNYKFDHDSIILKLYPFGINLKSLSDAFKENGMPIVGILGSDFLKTHDAIIDYKNLQLIITE